MKIIAHRGMWFSKNEQNTLVAFERALENGFGIETDFRDFNGSLVISHDLPLENALKAGFFFDLCNQYSSAGPHAINVKSDGLQTLLAQYLQLWHFEKYFIFDMSIFWLHRSNKSFFTLRIPTIFSLFPSHTGIDK